MNGLSFAWILLISVCKIGLVVSKDQKGNSKGLPKKECDLDSSNTRKQDVIQMNISGKKYASILRELVNTLEVIQQMPKGAFKNYVNKLR